MRQALHALKNLPAGAKVLEVGSGAGQFIRGLKKARPDLLCFGIDISQEAIREATKFADGVTYAVSTATDLGFSDNYFEAVVIFDVLEHVPDPADFLLRANRVLKPGGRFYGFVPCEGDGLSLWHILDRVGLKKDLTKRFAGHIQYFSRGALQNLLIKAGFKNINCRYSEHILGQILGVVAFYLMARQAKSQTNGSQINNEQYFARQNTSGLARLFKDFVNSLVYSESVLLTRVASPNVHVFAKK